MTGDVLWVLLALPIAGSLACILIRSPRAILLLTATGVPLIAVVSGVIAWRAFTEGPLASSGQWLYLDALSAYHLIVMMLIFALSSLFAHVYFGNDHAPLSRRGARRFGALWHGALAAMALVILSNNLGIMWVGVEATTLLTAFLICLHVTPVSLEATWKYLIVCSVGVAFAFMGTLLIASAAAAARPGAGEFLNWTYVRDMAGQLDPTLVKLAFIFLLVGYGTKVGLAPLHSWLPDAHSQAPAPVSALFSGFLLNTALYCIMRFIPIVETSTGNAGWARGLLVFFGLFSILLAAAFILAQHDLKRLLAYHSVEHLGIIAVGLGLGHLGSFAALFHTLNHSVCKALGFFSAGRVGQIYGTHDMRKISGTLGVHRLWGIGLFGSILALIGVAPFAIFMSEFLIVKAAAEMKAYGTLVVFLLGAGIVFIGALKHAIDMAWGRAEGVPPAARRASLLECAIVILPLALLLVLGLWMPQPLRDILDAAARILGGTAQ